MMYTQQPPQAYAPTPYSYTPTSTLSATINLDEEVRLASTNAERNLYESLAEIYSIIVTLDALERAFLKDSIPESEYAEICSRLLKQYKSSLADNAVLNAFKDLDSFKADWQIDCPRATERIRIGIAATVTAPAQQSSGQQGSGPAPGLILNASEFFITFLDAVKIGMLSKDTLHPLLVETIQAVNKVTSVEFEGKEKIIHWLITLNQMRAAESISEEQKRELEFDIEQAYKGFKTTLE